MRLATSTVAILAMTAMPALAESHASSNMDSNEMKVESGSQNVENLIRTRDITGGNIYAMESIQGEWTEMSWDGVDNEWEDIGEIEDVILDENGKMQGIVAEVGGFLDIADKHVFLSVDDVKLVPVDDQTYAYVTRYTEEELEEMQSVDEGWWN